MATFDAVLFDLDGTLIENDQTGEELYAGAFATTTIERFGEPTDLWSALDGPPDSDNPEAQLVSGFDRVASQYGRVVDSQALARGLMEIVDHTAVSFLPGAMAALETARTHAHVGLVTNGPKRRQAIKLDALGIEDAFDVLVFAGDMDRQKPHPDPFERALTRLGVDADSGIHVGNSLEFDVVGAQRAGLDAAWCPGDPDWAFDTEQHTPEYVLTSLDELVAILDGL